MSYYAGKVCIDKHEDEVQITYAMTCTIATPSPSAGQKSRTWHGITKLPEPTTVVDVHNSHGRQTQF